jgi:hypothetical protein
MRTIISRKDADRRGLTLREWAHELADKTEEDLAEENFVLTLLDLHREKRERIGVARRQLALKLDSLDRQMELVNEYRADLRGRALADDVFWRTQKQRAAAIFANMDRALANWDRALADLWGKRGQ